MTEARGLVCEVEPRQLHPPPDERRRDVDRRTHVGAFTGERVDEDRPLLALQLDRPHFPEREFTVRHPERGLRHVDLAGTGRRLDARRHVHRVAHDPVLGDAAHRSRDDHAGVHADPQADLDLALFLHPRDVLSEYALHTERGAQGALRIVLVRYGRAEDDEDRVADELLNGAVLAYGLFGQVLEDAGHEDLQLLGIHLVGELREAREVREEDGDEAALLTLLLQPLNDRRRVAATALYRGLLARGGREDPAARRTAPSDRIPRGRRGARAQLRSRSAVGAQGSCADTPSR